MKPSARPAIAAMVVLALLVAWSDRRLSAAMAWRYPPVTDLVVTEHYMGDIGALLLGARRLAADIAYIQLLQYYGVTESEEADDDHAHESSEEHAKHASKLSVIEHARRHDITRGKYPRLQELSTRILRLDPYFNGVILEGAGALAFNQRRVDEALDLLREAIERDPSFFRYHLYVSAILYRQKGNDAGMINLLMEAIKYPDCPPMFEMVLGNLLKRVGRPLDAARVFLHTYTTAAKDYEKADALRRLTLVVAENPAVGRQLEAEFPTN